MNKDSPVTFTSLLYSVVIGVAFQNIEVIRANEPNLLMIVALLVIFDDYFLYHNEIGEVSGTGRNLILVFWMDIVVLATWYAVSLTTRSGSIDFFSALSAFYTFTTIWEFMTTPPRERLKSVWRGGLRPLLAAVGCTVIAVFLRSSAPPFWLLPSAFIVALCLFRLRNYSEIWRRPAS